MIQREYGTPTPLFILNKIFKEKIWQKKKWKRK